jgi:hypothetical protein
MPYQKILHEKRSQKKSIALKINFSKNYYETLIKKMEEKKADEVEMAKKTSAKRKA